jgi:hypothetical protein
MRTNQSPTEICTFRHAQQTDTTLGAKKIVRTIMAKEAFGVSVCGENLQLIPTGSRA